MSVLEYPRIYFKGEISWDPITTNNYPENYDEDAGETRLPDVLNRVAAFREEAVQQIANPNFLSWDPHGTHRSNFYNTAVCGFDLGSGTQTADPFNDAAVNFSGMLVDLEPFGGYTSQLFFDSLTFGTDGGYCIQAPRTYRVTARHLNFFRNRVNTLAAGPLSVVWTASFAKTDGLRVNALDSPALRSLADALAGEDVLGLTVRFNTYRTVYYDDPTLFKNSPEIDVRAKELTSKIRSGGFQPNPGRSLMVGVIGLWRKGEPAHEPGDRILVPTAFPYPMAGAQIRTSANELTIDLSNSVPETDWDRTKRDFGTMTVIASDPLAPATVEVGTIPYTAYNREAYEATAGIVTLPLSGVTGDQLARMDLSLLDGEGNALLVEQPYRAIAAVPNLYLDETQSTSTSFQVYERGLPARAVVPFTLWQMSADGSTEQTGTPVETDSHGVFSFLLNGAAGGIVSYVPSFDASDVPTAGLSPQVNTYLYFRTRPADSAVAAMFPTWSNIYTRILANWNAMAPCMDNWLRLDDPVQVKAYGSIIKRLTDPANFESFRFMPVTRDMSAGERTLLYKFLDAPGIPEAAPKLATAVTLQTNAAPNASLAVVAEAEPRTLTNAEMSRASRTGLK